LKDQSRLQEAVNATVGGEDGGAAGMPKNVFLFQ
jgi:hypothetical protein